MVDKRFTCQSCLFIVLVTSVSAIQSDRNQKDSDQQLATRNKQVATRMNTTLSINNNTTSKENNQIAETCPSELQEFVSPVKGRPRCCRKCEAGTGMLRLCTDSEDTLCWPCEPRLEFAPTASATAKCLRCRRCEEIHPLAKIRTPCTPTKNTVCECRSGYFMSLENQTCKPCSVCRSGEAVFKPCEWDSDTQCQACPRGFWSRTSFDSVKCIPCQSCSTGQVVIRECSGSANTLCCPKTNPNCTAKDLPVYGDYLSYRNKASDELGNRVKHTEMLPIYCSFMGLIIVCLILYVIYKLWRQRESVAKSKLMDIYCVEENRLGAGDKFLQSDRLNNSHLAGDYSLQRSNTASSSGSSQRGGRSDPGADGGERMDYRDNGGEEYRQLFRTVALHVSSTGCAEKELLNSLPIQTLGMLCYQLSMKGWRQVAAGFGLREHTLQELRKDGSRDTYSYTSLMRAAVLAKSVTLSHAGVDSSLPQDAELSSSVRLLDELCNRVKPISLTAFSVLLQQADRSDLLPMLSGVMLDRQHLTTNSVTS